MKPSSALRTIKLIHTVIWALFAGCILAIPFSSHAANFLLSCVLIGVVTFEVVLIAVNRGSCPLTDVAARFTEDRTDNFDIYLPVWIARYNKAIFGTLFLLGVLYTLFQWVIRGGAT
ncbi:MAG: hypothetical protein EG822_17050 [Deltaproteobacteria bacterium]|nr:hypothetical protein [Deltaproteobacteria bacterium]TLN03012.1 MAG: hypothetical protein FDZ73_09465 [bacterium]